MLLCIALLSLAAGCATATDPPQSAYLDVQERFYIEWDYSDTNISILARVNTTGWFGIGFSPKGGMAGADIITAGVKDGVPYLQDRYAERNGYPALDHSQDVHLISGSEVDGITTIKFTRKHNTCDDDKDMKIFEDTMRVIYAISDNGSDDLMYHGDNRGTKSLYLRRKLAPDDVNMPADAFTMDITINNYALPAAETTYLCELQRVPKLSGKHHIVKVDPLIQQDNLGVVHHIIVFGCYDKVDREHYFEKNNTAFNCDLEANMPSDVRDCKMPVAAWAVGGGSMHYPEEAGFPLGDIDSPNYFMMETHYDNPQGIAGKRDSSGVRFTLTKTLRQHDAGILTSGDTFGIAVPPGLEDFQHYAVCSSNCTRQLLTEPAKIFGAMLHGHLATTQVIARQFRDGKDLRVIDQDRGYDFNYQQYKHFEQPLDFLPGDDIMVTCHYNTKGRTNMTYGGLPSRSEMCLAFLSVYPVKKMGGCAAMPAWAVSADAADKFITQTLGYNSAPGEWYIAVFNRMEREGAWTEERVRKLEQTRLEFTNMDICYSADSKIVYDRTMLYTPLSAMKSPAIQKADEACPSVSPDTVVGK